MYRFLSSTSKLKGKVDTINTNLIKKEESEIFYKNFTIRNSSNTLAATHLKCKNENISS